MPFFQTKIELNAKISLLILLSFLSSCQSSLQEELNNEKLKNNKLRTSLAQTEASIEKYKKLLEECKYPNSSAMENSKEFEFGLWKTPAIYGGGSLRLFRKNNEIFKTETLSDGSSFTHKMTLTKELTDLVFKSQEKISSDRWVVDQKGQLRVIDKDGLIYKVD